MLSLFVRTLQKRPIMWARFTEECLFAISRYFKSLKITMAWPLHLRSRSNSVQTLMTWSASLTTCTSNPSAPHDCWCHCRPASLSSTISKSDWSHLQRSALKSLRIYADPQCCTLWLALYWESFWSR